MKKCTAYLTIICFLASCIGSSNLSSSRRGKNAITNSEINTENENSNNNSTGNEAAPGEGDLATDLSDLISSGKQELRHIIDPFTGTYKTKITIPKNYKGPLYISGINLTSLEDRFVYVRFRFGREKEEITLPATLTRGTGIIPQTDIQLLYIDLDSQPFRDLRLLYDLYDYNDYDSNDDGVEFSTGDSLDAPTDDPRDTAVYCRGLNLEDDPTFQLTTNNTQCDTTGEKCLYSYAKVLDSLLFYNDLGVMKTDIVSEPSIDIAGSGYANESQSELLKKCLPDHNDRTSIELALQGTLTSSSLTVAAYGDTIYSGAYEYRGPYRTANRSEWEISSDAIFSDVSAGNEGYGLFQFVLGNAPTATVTDINAAAEAGIKSFLFPRAGKMSLSSGVEYIGYTDLTMPLENRFISSLVAGGDSNYMDGCNIRVSNNDSSTNEGIGSCNVSATIEIIAQDDSGETVVLHSSNDVKIQLTRESRTDYEGKEFLYSALKNCSNNQACGVNECCFNKRCWSKELVSQCIDDDDETSGNRKAGEYCSSDFQCQSLCCNPSNGSVCTEHNPNNDVSCNKPIGQSCISKDYCKAEYVNTCYIINTGTHPDTGQLTCTKQCILVETTGDCINGTCRAPVEPTQPTFIDNDPDFCRDNGVDPSVLINN